MSDPNLETNQAFTPEDIENSKVMAGLAYILFFLPLLACPDSPLAGIMPIKGCCCLYWEWAGALFSVLSR